MTVTGQYSEWDSRGDLHIGQGGLPATVEVKAGATMSSYVFYVGSGTGDGGTLIVEGNESTLHLRDDPDLASVVGYESRGEMIVRYGGRVMDGSAIIGHRPSVTGVVTIDGDDSFWNASGNLTIGALGHGFVEVTDGASLSASSAVIGEGFGSTGELSVDGEGSLLGFRDLTISQEGTGIVNITNGSRVDVSDTLVLGPRGTLNLKGGALSVDWLDLSEGNLNLRGGALTIHNGAIIHQWTDHVIEPEDDLDLKLMNSTLSLPGRLTLGAGTHLELEDSELVASSLVLRGDSFRRTGHLICRLSAMPRHPSF